MILPFSGNYFLTEFSKLRLLPQIGLSRGRDWGMRYLLEIIY